MIKVLLLFNLFIACMGSDNTAPQTVLVDVASIQEKVKQMSLQQEERIWDRIPWKSDLETAKKVSTESGRPIFLFSMHGDLDGRC